MKRALIIAALLWPPEQYATTYGQVVINHLNFTRDRINPYFTQNATVGSISTSGKIALCNFRPISRT